MELLAELSERYVGGLVRSAAAAPQGGAAAAAAAAAGPGPVVVELSGEEAEGEVQEQRARECAAAVALCVATHAAHPALGSPWTPRPGAPLGAFARVCEALFPCSGDAPPGDAPAWDAPRVLRLCQPSWRATLMAGGGRLDETRPESYDPRAGPGEFARALAARQLARVALAVGAEGGGSLEGELPALASLLAGALMDVLPAVRGPALAAVHRAAVHASPAALAPYAAMLRFHVAGAARGAPARVFPLAAAALAALAVAEAGADPRHGALEEVPLASGLPEALRHAYLDPLPIS